MTEAAFEKVEQSDTPLFGPEKILLCGFPAAAQAKFEAVTAMAGLKDVPLVWALDRHAETRLGELFAMPPGSGTGESSSLPRAVIVGGIFASRLHTLMAVCRKTGMKQALWATLTPTSETWRLKDLLAELSAEREALAKR